MSSSERSVYEFDSAIVRAPGRSVVDGLSAKPEPVSYDAVLREHGLYVQALKRAGLAVVELSALEAYPDSVFVEDPALVLGDVAVLLRPGAETRRGEVAEMAATLEEHFARVLTLSDGFADGGDVLVTSSEVLIGLSERTTRTGAAALAELLAGIDLNPRIVETPPDVLHFKSDCSLLDDRTILATQRLADAGVFLEHELLIVPSDEEAAANALRVNDVLLIGEQFPKTAKLLAGNGYSVVPLPTREIGKIDAGLSCMSLRWRR